MLKRGDLFLLGLFLLSVAGVGLVNGLGVGFCLQAAPGLHLVIPAILLILLMVLVHQSGPKPRPFSWVAVACFSMSMLLLTLGWLWLVGNEIASWG